LIFARMFPLLALHFGRFIHLISLSCTKKLLGLPKK
jgi:hypothetical protein